jgi:putative spermidine/putrescine transport system permease protein/spermidine/putrescine transport system permease protein
MPDAASLAVARPSYSVSETGLMRVIGWAFAIFLSLYVLIPIMVTAVMSLNQASMIRFPLAGWSLKWYAGFVASSQWTAALGNSIFIAIGTTLLSTSAGITAAWTFYRYQFPFKNVVYLLLVLPLFMPGVVLGLGVSVTFGSLTIAGVPIYGSRLIVILAHSLWAMPLVFMLMEATFRTLDKRIIEASYDLGASRARTFFEIVLPIVSTGVLASVLFAFVISLNEFMMALFLTARDTQTLPVLMWLSLRSAGTPNLAVAAVILAGTVFACLAIMFIWNVRTLKRAAR